MKRLLPPLGLTALLALAALLALGAAPGRTPTAPAAPGPQSMGPTGVVLPAADPMASEMLRELERGQREYGALFQRLALARNESEALGIEEEMRQQHVGMQVALLRIQAAYARRAGRSAFADRLEQAVRALIASDPPRNAPADPRVRS